MMSLGETVYFSHIKCIRFSNHLTILDEDLLKAIHESIKILNTPTTIILYLQSLSRISDKQTRDEEEFLRIGKKVDRALEKLRRSALKCIESTLSSSRAVISVVRELLLRSVSCWRTCLTTPVSSLMPTSYLTYDCIRVYLASGGFNSEGCINTNTRYVIRTLSD